MTTITLSRNDAKTLVGYLRGALYNNELGEFTLGAAAAKTLLRARLGGGGDPITIDFATDERLAAAACWEVYSETDPGVSNAQYEGVLAALGNGR